MNVVEHNNATSGLPVGDARSSTIVTLRDVIGLINASEAIPASQKRYLRSALKRANVLLSNGLADVRADPKDVLRRLDQLSPATADMTSQSWANLKSRVRSALRYAAPQLAPARSRIKLEREWAALAAAAPRRERCQLSRLFRFAQDKGWLPGDIGEPQLEQFEDHLEHEAIHSDSVHVVRTTRRAWNRCVDTVPGWPDRRLAAPARRGAPYYLRLEQLPATLQQEIKDYLHRLEHPDPFLGPGGKTLAPATIGQLRITFITLASALVASGMPVDKLSSIATLVQPDNLERALRFLYARAGHRVYHLMLRVVRRARTIGVHVGLPAQDLARIDSIVASVKREQPSQYGLTPKNRGLLARFDDPAFVDRLLTFPQRLVQDAKAATNKRHAATRARDAVAVELLLMCGMRLGNLARLRVGETIRKVGEGRDAQWVVDLPAEQVKNRQPLKVSLPAESGQLIDWYLTNWHTYLVRSRRALAVPCQGRGARRPAAADDLDQEARAPVRRGRDHLPPIPALVRPDPFAGAPARARGCQPAPWPPEVGHNTHVLRPRADPGGDREIPSGPRQEARQGARTATEEAQAQGIGAMTSPRLCLPLEDWPAIDRARWLAAQKPAGFLDDVKPASKWSAGSKIITEQGYGQWLAFLDRIQALDPSSTPGDRVTVDHLREFVAELQGRVAPVSLSIAAGTLLRMLRVLEPQRDWTVLAHVYRQLKRTATPSRDKLSRMVPATDLLAMGIRLMQTWADVRPQQVYKAAQFRDGLIIAILICCPMRLRNLTEIVIDRHLLFDGHAYRIELTAAETKAGRLYHASVPVELTAYVEDYLQVHRPRLQSIARADGPGTGGRLWLGRRGKPLSSGAVQRLIVARTTEAFGKPIYPHLFRDIAVTELVDFAPDEIGIAPDLLGHADLRTTQKYYIQAVGMQAHARVQEVIAARRRAATSRDTTETSGA